MKKKIFFMFVFLLAGSLFTGCGKVIDLTDEQTTLIAEYAAELLLKYDVNYVDRMEDGEKELKEQSQDKPPEETMQDTVTEADTTVATSKPEPAENTDMQSDKGSGGESAEVVDDIAGIVGMDGVSITYKDYLVTQHYPTKDAEGEFIYLDASKGYQLLVLQFNVVNKTEKEVSLSLLDKGIGYQIICNGSHAADPMLTILMNDLGTLDTTLEPGKEMEAVLVFQIADSMKDSLDSIQLKVNYNDTDHIMNILN